MQHLGKVSGRGCVHSVQSAIQSPLPAAGNRRAGARREPSASACPGRRLRRRLELVSSHSSNPRHPCRGCIAATGSARASATRVRGTEARRRRNSSRGVCAMKLWLNVADAAEHAGVCRDTIYTAVERGELRHVRIGGRRSIRIKTEWVDGWLERAVRPPSRGSSSAPYATSGG